MVWSANMAAMLNRSSSQSVSKWRVLAALVGVCAAMMLVASPALALSGSSSSGNAAAAQYTPTANNGSANGNANNSNGNANNSNGNANQSAGNTTQQSSASLPFTGYAVLSALGIGVVMLSIGAVMRRRSSDSL